jgi:peptidoglycan-N-acetylglucosamine deacetylase
MSTASTRTRVRRKLGRVWSRAKSGAARQLASTLLATITGVKTTVPAAAITFDGGPDGRWTPQVLDILGEHGAKATFFVTGYHVEKHPRIMERMVEAGHVVGNHSWDHPSFPLVSGRERRSQLRRCERALAPYQGKIKLFRPPYLDQSLSSRLDAALYRYRVISTNLHAYDWEDRASAFMLECLVDGLAPGSIILLHDAVCDQRYRSRTEMLRALDAFLSHSSGSHDFVTVPDLLKLGRPVRGHGLKKPNVARFQTYERDFY